MAIPKYRIFFDTSVYIAALLSPKGAAGELIRLAEAGAITMVVSELVIIESDIVLGNKFPDIIEKSRLLWKHLAPEITSNLPKTKKNPFQKILPVNDASILWSAQIADVSMFVTWNTKDFMKPEIKSRVSFPLLIPGDALNLFREWIDPFLD